MNPVVHFEIPAADYERAKKFYSGIFGWKIEEWPGNPTKYGMATTSKPNSGAINGALMERGNGVESTVVTIQVSSINDYLKKIVAAGGKPKMPKIEVGGMGYNASFYDPEGNIVGLWEDIKKTTHYICTGGCKGVSDHPGVCQTDGCPLLGHELTPCDCTDDLHHNFKP